MDVPRREPFLPLDFQIDDPANPLFAGLRGDFLAELKLFLSMARSRSGSWKPT